VLILLWLNHAILKPLQKGNADGTRHPSAVPVSHAARSELLLDAVLLMVVSGMTF
jgi:hypothetical protein